MSKISFWAFGALILAHEASTFVYYPASRTRKQSSCILEMSSSIESAPINGNNRRSVIQQGLSIFGATLSIQALMGVSPASARLDPVNRPDLLPKEPGLNVIQIEKFLTTGQAKRLDNLLSALERDTGFRVRVLCQAYPNTPGLAIKDYWDLGKEDQKDDKYVVLVVDQFGGKGK